MGSGKVEWKMEAVVIDDQGGWVGENLSVA